jgi:hypothetical protein
VYEKLSSNWKVDTGPTIYNCAFQPERNRPALFGPGAAVAHFADAAICSELQFKLSRSRAYRGPHTNRFLNANPIALKVLEPLDNRFR